MKSYELFERMSPALGAEILGWLQANQKPIYKTAIQGLAAQRNLRAVFIERKPLVERQKWMKAALSRKISATLGDHVIQAWLLGAHRAMLCEFLDALNIAHDEDGTVDQLPASPPAAQIAAAVEGLLAKYPAEQVGVYLQSFRSMDEASDWPSLRELLKTDIRLQFPVPSA